MQKYSRERGSETKIGGGREPYETPRLVTGQGPVSQTLRLDSELCPLTRSLLLHLGQGFESKDSRVPYIIEARNGLTLKLLVGPTV